MTVDLRSDTVTKPTAGMRQAMANAEVGDDVFGEDPTVNALEARTAELLGKEAALFVPSGTMANQLALRSVCEAGDLVLCEGQAHILVNEVGAAAVITGATLQPIRTATGHIVPDQIEEHFLEPDIHHPRSRVLAVENSHNYSGGSVYKPAELLALHSVANQFKLWFHCDGARLANAAVATDVELADMAQPFDSVTLCFSKGLGAPVGSVVASERDVIDKARRFRKMLGGGMRQAGVLAAAADYALDHHVWRMKIDHDRAKQLARALEGQDKLKVRPPETNMVVIDTDSHETSQLALKQWSDRGVIAIDLKPRLLRLVTHLDLDDEMIEHTVEVLSQTSV